VFAWLKESSPTGYLRLGNNINLRVQDGLKPKLLCQEAIPANSSTLKELHQIRRHPDTTPSELFLFLD
jgi:hypothetical protein